MTTGSVAFDRASRDLRVFISNRESRCDDRGDDLGWRAMIFLAGNRGALCLTCSDLDHLTFLPPGDAALTRRARKYSTLAAVVLKWSRARRRYERQGLLDEDQALQRAEAEYLNDAEARARRRDREAERRAELDAEFVARFAARTRQLYPRLPARSAGANRFACVPEVQGTHRALGGGRTPRRGGGAARGRRARASRRDAP